MSPRKRPVVWISVIAVIALAALANYCAPRAPEQRRAAGASDIAIAAQKVYVAPGDLDEYYMFASGGHSGQVYVYGIPSMRHISTIPVYAPYPATGYGFDDESKAMLGDLTWGDVHHPSAVRDGLRRAGVTHLFVNWFEVGRLRDTYAWTGADGVTRPGLPPFSPADFNRLVRAGVLTEIRELRFGRAPEKVRGLSEQDLAALPGGYLCVFYAVNYEAGTPVFARAPG